MPKTTLRVLQRFSFMLLIPLISTIHIKLNVYNPKARIFKTAIDDIIPFQAWFAAPYLFWFAYIVIALAFFAVVDYKYYFKLLMSIVTGMLFSFLFFYFIPTTVPRPEVLSVDVMSRAVGFIYSIDNPYNCFPSIHVLNSVLVMLFLCKYAIEVLWRDNLKKAVFLTSFSIASSVLISLSTLFIKQHYALDVAGGTLLAITVFIFYSNNTLWRSEAARRLVNLIIPVSLRSNPYSVDVE